MGLEAGRMARIGIGVPVTNTGTQEARKAKSSTADG